jgi:hypothetical protein
MGLDMFAWRVKHADALSDFEIAKNEDGDGHKVEEFFYWRKHHDLHGWMEKLYRSKGGDKQMFNCVPVRLTLEDLDTLQKDIFSGTLPQTQGFFFGDNPPDDESKQQDLQFIGAAKEIIRQGDAVYYDSWW